MKPKKPKYHYGKGKAYAWIVAHVSFDGQDCLKWPFSGARGRGALSYKGKRMYAARAMCELVHGPAPSPAHEAAHSCGNGHDGCVHPQHLSWKTRQENRRDCIEHGTSFRGNKNASAGKLTYDQAVEIRTRRGIDTADVLAKRYNVSPTAIYLVWKGQTFKSRDQARFTRWTPQEDERLRLAIKRGLGKHDAAKLVGRGADQLWRRARELGIFQPPLKRGLPPAHVRRF